MKRLLVGMAAVASFAATGALAADLPAKAPVYTKAPVYVDPVFDWTGFYVGGNLGYSWGRSSDTSTVTNTLGVVTFTGSDKSNLDGIVGGGQIGYNWQMQSWLFGLEADIQGTGEKGSRSFLVPFQNVFINAPPPPVPYTLEQKIDWFGTVRGRIGVLATPKVLLYATGGLAYGDVHSNETVGVTTPLTFGSSNTHVGWTLGAGIEGAIGGNWTARLEYLYVDLGTVSGSFAVPVGISTYSSHITDNILRVGINYKFGGSPVVAKY